MLDQYEMFCPSIYLKVYLYKKWKFNLIGKEDVGLAYVIENYDTRGVLFMIT